MTIKSMSFILVAQSLTAVACQPLIEVHATLLRVSGNNTLQRRDRRINGNNQEGNTAIHILKLSRLQEQRINIEMRTGFGLGR